MVCFGRGGGEGAATRVSTRDMQSLAMIGAYAATQTCYGYTGGSCSLENCDPTRKATCTNGLCVCEAACAGSDGTCYAGQSNTLVATDFTLTNVKWPKYSMYFQGMSAFGQLKTTKAYSVLNLGKDKFSLYKMPGNKSRHDSRFFLGSVKWPSR